MEAALVSGLLKVIGPKLLQIIGGEYKLRQGLRENIEFLEEELQLIHAVIDEEISKGEDQGAVLSYCIEKLRELAHGIEDCVDNIMYRAAMEQQSSLLPRICKYPTKFLSLRKIAKKMQKMRKMVQGEDITRLTRSGKDADVRGTSSTQMVEPWSTNEDLVGIKAPLTKLLKQLAQANGKRNVISIVGFCGMGKTALAAELRRREQDNKAFDLYSWACAAHKGPVEVLTEIISNLSSGAGPSHGTSNVHKLSEELRHKLGKKRYFIVIDDIQTADQWKSIISAFPADEGDVSSRIVVTTTIRSVANVCSSGGGYVHKMSRLGEVCSKELFDKKACPQGYSSDHNESAEILEKCDGQPLALVTVGEFLKGMSWLTEDNCGNTCKELHYHLNNNRCFDTMRRALTRSYTSLPDNAHKSCLLYFSMFPSRHPIKRKSLLRLWTAEGFVTPMPSPTIPDAAIAFHELIDRNIIDSIHKTNNDSVKTWHTYGMMRQFILYMSTSQNFVTLFSDDMLQHKYIRRISFHDTDDVSLEKIYISSAEEKKLSLVRSLTICGKGSEKFLDFSKYQLLRVLDLQECVDLNDGHLKEISNLLLLKYLSLGGNVTRVPTDIAKLKQLETFDVRGTKIEEIPLEVFQLPCLTHLLGKFKVSDNAEQMAEVKESVDEKSNLQTLAGFATDGSEGFLQLVGCMKKLRKVKVWCEPSEASTDWTDLTMAIQQFIQDEKDANIGTRSLSLHFDELSKAILSSIQAGGYLTSLKLYCNSEAWPAFVISLTNLKELCLSSPGLQLPSSLLESLGNLMNLKYLKLIAKGIEKFVIKGTAFPKLLQLCLVLQCPTLPTIENGALPYLHTLQLLCKDLPGLSGIKIECLKHLQEITLDPEVATETRSQWENAAEGHPNRPRVLPLQTEKEPSGDSVASETPETQTTKNAAVFSSETVVSISGNGVIHCNT